MEVILGHQPNRLELNEGSAMKWTYDFVWTKVESLVPNAQLCGYALPEALKAAAVELFLLDENHHNGSFRAYVVSDCIKELKNVGYLTQGDVAEDWL